MPAYTGQKMSGKSKGNSTSYGTSKNPSSSKGSAGSLKGIKGCFSIDKPFSK